MVAQNEYSNLEVKLGSVYTQLTSLLPGVGTRMVGTCCPTPMQPVSSLRDTAPVAFLTALLPGYKALCMITKTGPELALTSAYTHLTSLLPGVGARMAGTCCPTAMQPVSSLRKMAPLAFLISRKSVAGVE